MHPDALLGRIISGRFQIAAFIREGGMARVYCGVQDKEPRHVALKIMHPSLARDKKLLLRFKREADAAARIRHPNAVQILGFGTDGDLVFIAMELLVGHDLLVPLTRDGRMSEQRAADVIAQVCSVLSLAHRQNVVHRDLKPENIMLVRDPDSPSAERVKVLDFGIAKILDEHEGTGVLTPRADAITSVRSALTRVGQIVGTPAYMSPEQGRAEAVDHRTDLYSCGVLLYELIVGAPPFTGETALQVVMRHVNEPPIPPREMVPIHPGLEAIILKSLAKFPAERHQSADELEKELTALLPELATMPRVREAPKEVPSVVVRVDADLAADDMESATGVRPGLEEEAEPMAVRGFALSPGLVELSLPTPASGDDDDEARTLQAEGLRYAQASAATAPILPEKANFGQTIPMQPRDASNGAAAAKLAARVTVPMRTVKMTDDAAAELRRQAKKPRPAAGMPAVAPELAAASRAVEQNTPSLPPLPLSAPESATGPAAPASSLTQAQQTRKLLVVAIGIGIAVLIALVALVVVLLLFLSRDAPAPHPTTVEPVTPKRR